LRNFEKWLKKLRRNLQQQVEDLRFDLSKLMKSEKLDYREIDIIKFTRKALKINPFPYQAKLLKDNKKRLVACMGRQSGKTTTIAIKAIHFALTNEGVTILITSPSLRQSMIMFNRIHNLIYTNPTRNQVTRATRTIIQFKNQSQIIALPASENLLRGYTAHMIICDEAAFMPEELITNVIFPMISTTNGYAIFLSTPWGRNHFFYRAFMNPNYSTHRVKSTECPLIKKEFLQEMQRNMTEDAFKREYLAEFTESSTAFFSQDLIRSCIDPELEFLTTLQTSIPPGEYYGGADFGKLEDHSVLTILQHKGNLLKLIYLHEFPIDTPYTNVIGHIVQADKKFNFHKILIDQTGVGEPVLEELKNQGIQNIEGLTFTTKTKEELLTSLKILMEQKRLKMPYHRRLCQQINEQEYQYSKSGYLTFNHPTGSHDDMLFALALGCYAATMGRKASSRLMRAY